MLHKHKPFIQAISIALLQVHYYSEALPTQHGYCVGVSRRSATGNCEWRTVRTKGAELANSHHATQCHTNNCDKVCVTYETGFAIQINAL